MSVKRIRGLGGVDVGMSNNPSFQRGMLKGLCRALMAGKNTMSIVCKVNVDERMCANAKTDGIRKENS